MADEKKPFTPFDLLAAAATKPAVQELFVPELAVNLHVREVTAAERDQLDELFKKGRDDESRAILIAFTLAYHDGTPFFPASVDAQGRPSFDPGVIDKLKALPARVAERLFRVALRVNGFGDQAGN